MEVTTKDVIRRNEELVRALSIKHHTIAGGLTKEETKALGSIVKQLFKLSTPSLCHDDFDIRYIHLLDKFEKDETDVDDLLDIFAMFRHPNKDNHTWIVAEASGHYRRYIEGLGKRKITLFKSNNIKIKFDCKKRLVRLDRFKTNRKYYVEISRRDLLHV